MRRPKIKDVVITGDTSLERFYTSDWARLKTKYKLPNYGEICDIGDVTKLWIERNDIKIDIILKNGDRFIYYIRKGFVYDKASVPIGKDNTLESAISARIHDIGCSTHCLLEFAIHNDKGFRANNLLFKALLYFYIEQDKKAQLKFAKKWRDKARIKWQAYRKRRRARIWYLAVNSIVGQGFYEKNKRNWHKKTTRFEYVKGSK
ncbi:hypothetical protein KAR91_53520 [Candidatus Pacearchaeota archaeon]|nr:hypothetical protein [Candidatus Pacearchaeota archaeon]